MLIGITGQKFSGKSTVAKMLSEMLFGYKIVSFADKLKDITCVLSGCTREQLEDYEFKEHAMLPDYLVPYCGDVVNPSYRTFLQHFGSEVMRGINDNIWIDCTLKDCNDMTIISDVRFPNEAKAIREQGGIIICVEREGLESNDTHSSETAMKQIVPDYIIENNKGLEELSLAVRHLTMVWKLFRETL